MVRPIKTGTEPESTPLGTSRPTLTGRIVVTSRDKMIFVALLEDTGLGAYARKISHFSVGANGVDVYGIKLPYYHVYWQPAPVKPE